MTAGRPQPNLLNAVKTCGRGRQSEASREQGSTHATQCNRGDENTRVLSLVSNRSPVHGTPYPFAEDR